MRTFSFKARNIGEEKYLTYTMGAETELDEDVLDYIEENSPAELLGIIYEEDDDYDYLTYDISEKVSLESFIAGEIKCERALTLLRNIANGLISVKEQAIHLTYILLNKSYVYVDPDTCEIKFICLPVESKASLAVEFKSFIRQLLANMIYDVDEDLSYVGKLLTYINGDSFNLRGLIGLSEALMEEQGISFEETGATISDGVEVINTDAPEETEKPESSVSDFMNNAEASDEPLPEIGDDEEAEEAAEEEPAEEEEELESILPAGMSATYEKEDDSVEGFDYESPVREEAAEEPEEEAEEETTSYEEEESYEEEAAEEEAVNYEEEEDSYEEEPESHEKPTFSVHQFSDEDAQEEEEDTYEPEPEAEPEQVKKHTEKEADIDIIKSRIRELVGDVPEAKSADKGGKSINSISDLNTVLGGKNSLKKKPVKVNRAAMIQRTAEELEAERADADGETEDLKVPVIEDVYEDMNIDKTEEKPKSTSVLSKTVKAITGAATSQLPKALPYLIRISTEERIMLSKDVFKIGKATRGVDYTVSGNGAISRQHAIISQRDGVCYIKDNKSTNHTYVNDQVVADGEEEILTHDSIIRLGDEEFRFKIR